MSELTDAERERLTKVRGRITPLDTVATATTIERAQRDAVDRLEQNRTLDLPNHKTCSKCASPSRDDPCDKCYNKARADEKRYTNKDGERLCMSCGKEWTKHIYCERCEDYLV